MTVMTSRERVLAALSHRQPDRVPLDLGGTRNSTMVAEGYERLQGALRVSRRADRMIERMMRVVEIDERGLLRALSIDTRRRLPGGRHPRAGVPTSGRAATATCGAWSAYSPRGATTTTWPARRWPGTSMSRTYSEYPWPDPDDSGFTAGLNDRVRWIREHTDAASVLALPPAFVHISQYLRGFEDWFCDFVAEPKRLEVLFDAILDVTMAIAKRQLQEVGREVDVVLTSDDLGSQNALPGERRALPQVHQAAPAAVLPADQGTYRRQRSSFIPAARWPRSSTT